jgi:putative membrane protein
LATGLVAQWRGDHMDWGAGWWVVMGIGMLLLWALVIVAIVWLIRLTGLPRKAEERQSDPLGLLDRRLAEGEIDIDDYEARRRKLLER